MTHEAKLLIAWFAEEDGFKNGTKAPHKWVLQVESELRRQDEAITKIQDQRTQELRAYELTVSNLRAKVAALEAAAPQAVQPAVPSGQWIERWHGSGGKEGHEGWSILDADSRALVAYLGRDVDSEAVTAIVMAHNSAHPAEGVPAQAVQITLTGYQLLAALRLANPSLDFAPMELLTDIVLSETPLVDFDGAQLHEGPIAWVDGVNESAIALEAEPENDLRAATQPAAQWRTTGYIVPKGRYVPPVLFNPYSGEPRDARDIASDPNGILIIPLGADLAATQPAAQGMDAK